MRFMKVEDPAAPDGVRYKENVDFVRKVEGDDPAHREDRETYVVRRSDGMEVYADRNDLHPEDLEEAQKAQREGDRPDMMVRAARPVAAERAPAAQPALFGSAPAAQPAPQELDVNVSRAPAQQSDGSIQAKPSAAVIEERKLAAAMGASAPSDEKDEGKKDKATDVKPAEAFSDSAVLSTSSAPVESPPKKK